MDVIEEELGKLSFLDPHSSEFKYEISRALSLSKARILIIIVDLFTSSCTASYTTNP